MNIRRDKIVFKGHVTHRAYVTLDNGRTITLDTDELLDDEVALVRAQTADIPLSAIAVETDPEADALLDELEGLIDG